MVSRLRWIAQQALALAIGIGSGWLAYRVQMPLPWMLGAMIGTTVAAMSGVPVSPPGHLRPLVIPIIGVMLGSSLRADVVLTALGWIPSMLLLPVFLSAAAGGAYLIYRRFGGYDPVTAFFAAMPGGLNEMVIYGAEVGADERRVALAHTVRILFAITAIALFFGLYLGVSRGSTNSWLALSAFAMTDVLWLSAAAIIGAALARVVKIPAGSMLLPMVLSAAAHIGGLVSLPPPTLLVITAQVVMGTVIGCRFVGVRLSEIRLDLMLGLITTLQMLVLAVGFAWLAHLVSGTARSQTFLAYAPGGLTEMSLLALAMGQDVAYVSVTHIARIVLVLGSAPLVFRLFRRDRD